MRPKLGRLNQYTARSVSLTQISSEGHGCSALKVSLVTPSYNQGRFIERTIQSILTQSYSNFEFFIQDGGSTDSTIDIISRHQGMLSGWASETDSGQAQAINKAFARSTGEIMAWINSDDLLLPGTLAFISEFFGKNPQVDVVYGNRIIINEDDLEIGRWILPCHDGELLSWVDFVPQESLFWRRRIWDKVGGYVEESFNFAMDWELLLRFREAGAKFAHQPELFGLFRVHSNQKTSADLESGGKLEMNKLRKKYLNKVPSRFELRFAVLPYIIKHLFAEHRFSASNNICKSQ
jgi:glycosyltransferase involved in cell wall biosynthesis